MYMQGENAAHGKPAFIEELKELNKRCGATLREIEQFSRTLMERYPRHVTGNAPPTKLEAQLESLAVSTISQILGNIVRKGLPRWTWVASFVLSCNGLAFEKGIIDAGIR